MGCGRDAGCVVDSGDCQQNNFRVYDERRVPFWGRILAGEDMEGDDAADLEVEEDDAP